MHHFQLQKIKFSGEGIASQGLTHPHPHTTPVLLRIRNVNVFQHNVTVAMAAGFFLVIFNCDAYETVGD